MNRDLQHINNLIATKRRRLQFLELQQARHGSDCPPHILMEIEDIQSEINKLESQSRVHQLLDKKAIDLESDVLGQTDERRPSDLTEEKTTEDYRAYLRHVVLSNGFSSLESFSTNNQEYSIFFGSKKHEKGFTFLYLISSDELNLDRIDMICNNFTADIKTVRNKVIPKNLLKETASFFLQKIFARPTENAYCCFMFKERFSPAMAKYIQKKNFSVMPIVKYLSKELIPFREDYYYFYSYDFTSSTLFRSINQTSQGFVEWIQGLR